MKRKKGKGRENKKSERRGEEGENEERGGGKERGEGGTVRIEDAERRKKRGSERVRR